jgi:hypothetical protein
VWVGRHHQALGLSSWVITLGDDHRSVWVWMEL